MLKNKKILLKMLVLILLLIIPNIVNASNENPTTKTEISSADKSVKVTLTDVSLDDTKEYKFGISKAKATQPSEWLDLQDADAEQCTAIITPQNEEMRIILRSNDKCFLFIKNTTDDQIAITTQVELPDILDIKINTNEKFEFSYLYEKCRTFYENLGNYQITAVKLDDKDIINKYLEAKENNQNAIDAVKDKLPKEIPTTSWTKMYSGNDFTYTSADFSIMDLIKYEGLYMVWGQVSYIEGRTIYGYMLYDNYPDGYKLPEDKDKTDTTEPDTTTPDDSTGKQNTDNNKQQVTNDVKQNTSNNEKDPTTAPGSIPYTGGTFAVVITLIVIAGIGIYTYKRNKDLRGI